MFTDLITKLCRPYSAIIYIIVHFFKIYNGIFQVFLQLYRLFTKNPPTKADGFHISLNVEYVCPLFFCNHQQFIGGAVQQQAHGLDVFIADRLGFVVDHLAEILVAYTQLLVEPVFCLSILFRLESSSSPRSCMKTLACLPLVIFVDLSL